MYGNECHGDEDELAQARREAYEAKYEAQENDDDYRREYCE